MCVLGKADTHRYNRLHMTSAPSSPIKRPTRTRKTIIGAVSPIEVSTQPKHLSSLSDAFVDLLNRIAHTKEECEHLQKEIAETRDSWTKEQTEHEHELVERKTQEELARRREQELYEYEMNLKRRKDEDSFAAKKAEWENELAGQKETIEKEREELVMLRKHVENFDVEKEKSVKEACTILEKTLTEKFAIEKRIREQEIKSEKDIFALRITGLTEEKNKLTNEIEQLKKSLDETTKQLKDVAMKVIESRRPTTPNSSIE